MRKPRTLATDRAKVPVAHCWLLTNQYWLLVVSQADSIMYVQLNNDMSGTVETLHWHDAMWTSQLSYVQWDYRSHSTDEETEDRRCSSSSKVTQLASGRTRVWTSALSPKSALNYYLKLPHTANYLTPQSPLSLTSDLATCLLQYF